MSFTAKNVHNLTEEQVTILNYLCSGYTDKEISDMLCITVYTVRSHINNIRVALKLSRYVGSPRTRYTIMIWGVHNGYGDKIKSADSDESALKIVKRELLAMAARLP